MARITVFDLMKVLKDCDPTTTVLVHIAGTDGYAIGEWNGITGKPMDGTKEILLQCEIGELEPYSQADEAAGEFLDALDQYKKGRGDA